MPENTATPTLLVINRWLVIILAVLMVVTAALAGNGLFKRGSDPWLITGHQHLGNLIFFVAIAQVAICYALYSQARLRGSVMLTSIGVLILTIAQFGLGYATRENLVNIVGWHIAVGVGLTAVVGVLITQLWQQSAPPKG
ncbi:MAG: hypothetical protein KC435_03905 [Thermomicrobiales bacterium]|nr:hypothetical protein [Thermomicrobiales bacterium]